MRGVKRGGLFPLLGVACACLLGCEPWSSIETERTSYRVIEAQTHVAPAPSPTSLRVMTWNVKYGAGRVDFWFDLWGDETRMSREVVGANLAGLCTLINEVRPDVLVANEIDVNSRRSAYVDMVRAILACSSLNYAGYVPTWKSRYVPSEGVGRMDMGNAVFSTYPITLVEGIPHTQRGDQDAVTDYFYLHRSIIRAVLDLGAGREVAVLGVHTDAYDTDGTKQKQLVEIAEIAAAETIPFVLAGDFNAIPPGSIRTAGFNDDHPDAIGTDFETPPYLLTDMEPFFDAFVPAIALDRYGTTETEQRRFYTHSIIGPNRTGSLGEPGFWTRQLDYLFVDPSSSWREGSTDVLQERGRMGIASEPLLLSDHAPVVGVWELAR